MDGEPQCHLFPPILPSSFSAVFGTLALVFAFVSSSYSATYNVTVGLEGQLVYSPEFVRAVPGDTINFIFNPINHTVTQSSFDNPCQLLDGGFDSEYIPVGAGTTDLPTWQLEVPQSGGPIWFYCKQPIANHCGRGMVFAINPPEEGEMTFEAFKARARGTFDANSTTSTTPASAATSTATNNPGNSSNNAPLSAHVSWVAIGLFILSGLMLWRYEVTSLTIT